MFDWNSETGMFASGLTRILISEPRDMNFLGQLFDLSLYQRQFSPSSTAFWTFRSTIAKDLT